MKSRALVIPLPAFVLCLTLSPLAADDRDTGYRLPKGTKAVAFKLAKDQKIPDGVLPGKMIDIVGEIGDPIKTGIALLNVKLLAVDGIIAGVDQAMTVQLTPAQMEVLALMQKHGTKLGVKLNDEGKLKP